MRSSKFSKHKQLEILTKLNSGASMGDLCQEYQVSKATLYRWKAKTSIVPEDQPLDSFTVNLEEEFMRWLV